MGEGVAVGMGLPAPVDEIMGVLGGFGYLPGAIVGGLVIGVVEGLASMVLPSVYKDVIAFVLLIGFLLFRPQGILGKRK